MKDNRYFEGEREEQAEIPDSHKMVKFLADFVPLIVFFVVFKMSDAENPLIPATIYLVAATIVGIIASYAVMRKVPMNALFSAALLSVFGGLTVYLNDDRFIKMKPTIVGALFAAILFGSAVMKKPAMKYVLGSAMKMSEKMWRDMTIWWGGYFLIIAVVNELVWRNFDSDVWVTFKVFGILGMTLAFVILQAMIFRRK